MSRKSKRSPKTRPPKHRFSKGGGPKKRFTLSAAAGLAIGVFFVGFGLYGVVGQGKPGGLYLSALGLLVFGAVAWSYRGQ